MKWCVFHTKTLSIWLFQLLSIIRTSIIPNFHQVKIFTVLLRNRMPTSNNWYFMNSRGIAFSFLVQYNIQDKNGNSSPVRSHENNNKSPNQTVQMFWFQTRSPRIQLKRSLCDSLRHLRVVGTTNILHTGFVHSLCSLNIAHSPVLLAGALATFFVIATGESPTRRYPNKITPVHE